MTLDPLAQTTLLEPVFAADLEPAELCIERDHAEAIEINARGHYYSTTTFRDDGKPIMCNPNGTRSVFCDVDEGCDDDTPGEAKVADIAPLAAPATEPVYASVSSDIIWTTYPPVAAPAAAPIVTGFDMGAGDEHRTFALHEGVLVEIADEAAVVLAFRLTARVLLETHTGEQARAILDDELQRMIRGDAAAA